MGEGKYYWLKLKKDFFKRHDIRVLRTRTGGEKLVLIYLMMMCESIDHNGELRFSNAIPYTADTLSATIGEDEETVDDALNVLLDFGLIEITEDKTIIMTKVQEMIGSASNSDGAVRQRRYRERLKNEDCVTECDEGVTDSVTKCNATVTDNVTDRNESKSKSKSKSKNIEKDNNTYVQEFDELWELYPRKQGKTNALKSYIKARKEGVTKEEVEQGILDYGAYIKTNNVEGKYIKMGSTWFNQRCWTDEHSMRVKSGRLDWIDEVEL